jgi:DNA polymerase-1
MEIMDTSGNIFVLIDGHAMAYRSYFAMIKSRLTSPDGEPTGALFAFTQTVLKILTRYDCSHVAVVFDSSVPTFRHERYGQYKANREAMPEDMVAQLPRIREVVDRMGLHTIQKDGYEADDVIAGLAQRARDSGMTVKIVSGDKDLMQLVGDRITMLVPGGKGEPDELDAAGVRTKMGVAPLQVRDFLALTGDTSDNVPGVPGVGPKTAVKLLAEVSSLDELLGDPARAGSPKLQKKIEEHKDDILLSKELVTLEPDAAKEVSLDTCAFEGLDIDRTRVFFTNMGLNSFLNHPLLDARSEVSFESIQCTDIRAVESIAAQVASAGWVCVDTETDSMHARQARLVGISLAVDSGRAYYLPLGHEENGGSHNLDTGHVRDVLSGILENESIRKLGHNLKYDYQVLKSIGIHMKGVWFDTMIAGYLVDPGKRRYSLDTMAESWCGVKTTTIESLIGKKGKDQRSFAQVPVDRATRYACEDVIVPILLQEKLAARMQQQQVQELFHTIEMPLVPVLAEMEYYGILLDTTMLNTLAEEYTRHLERLSERIYEMAGQRFNINSPKQLSEILFDRLNLPKSKRTKTGRSTDVRALEQLKDVHPIAEKLIEYREVQKLLSTYIEALPRQVLAVDKRLHTSFNQTIAATGRLSSNAPNLQNIPVRTEEGRKIRRAFVAPKGFMLVCADYSQIELRILAHMSQDENLTQAFRSDEDIHTRTAAAIYGVAQDRVDREMRRMAKTINFGLMYGMGPANLSQQLGISFDEAHHFIDTYFTQFPSIRRYIDTTLAQTREQGYTQTLFGRRRYMPEITAQNRRIREAAERTAINAPVQGSAADIIKIAMCRVHDTLHETYPAAHMLLQVHDELVFEVPDKEASTFAPWVQTLMQEACSLSVPLKVDVGWADNWSDAH